MSVTFLYLNDVGKITAPESPGIVRSILSYTAANFRFWGATRSLGRVEEGLPWAGGQGTHALTQKRKIRGCSQPNNANMKREKGE